MTAITRAEVQEIVDASAKKVIDEMSNLFADFMGMVDKRFVAVEDRLTAIEEDIAKMKADIEELKGNVATLKDDVEVLKDDVRHLRQNMREVKTTLTTLDGRLEALENDVKELYFMHTKKPNPVLASSKYDKLPVEEKVNVLNIQVQKLAKQIGVAL